ncbi:Histidine--tRNA ligase [Thermaerobacter marianensis DSM 12885]|uniref:Histidine--tRNA ligase n=1 Tax=Thermaerobacter marianensis (strain ATCC 700841 / DSM 12885 / JCM 10246 / 7p75a) TaxID=644966 RepID=E6SHF4_THEM7|nr:ATP phosphoribosyltransferase regulatory subunit [Thermaerobacter marianensis]ADU50718.1 Histidine--tRNA ligase [Thermaerobacter marianensis DSM 12885]
MLQPAPLSNSDTAAGPTAPGSTASSAGAFHPAASGDAASGPTGSGGTSGPALPTGPALLADPALAGDRDEEARRRLASLFARWGYRRIRTPLWEEAGAELLGVFPETALCRFVDPAGRVLALRPDHTLAVARWAAPRFHGPDPWRLSYVDPVYRRDPRDGRFTAVTQAGVELLGAPAPAGDVEILGLVLDALDALELDSPGPDGAGIPARVAVGHAGVLQQFLAAAGLDEPATAAVLAAVARRDRVALRQELEAALGGAAAARAYRVLTGSFPLAEARQILAQVGGEAAAELAAVLEAAGRFFGPRAAARIRMEPGLVRDLQYYTGLVVEVFAGRFRIAAGGRYDELLARFGGRGPAVGVAFDLEAVVAAEAAAGDMAAMSAAVPAGGAGSLPAGDGNGRAPDGLPGVLRAGVPTGGPGRATIDYLVAGPVPSPAAGSGTSPGADAAADGTGPAGAISPDSGTRAAAPPAPADWPGAAERLWEEARRLRQQGASAVVMAGLASEDAALDAARRLGCLRLLWLDGTRRVLRMAWPVATTAAEKERLP